MSFFSYAHSDLFAFIGLHPVTFGKYVADFCLYLHVYMHLQTVCTTLGMPGKHKSVAAVTILVLANLCFPNYCVSLHFKKTQTKTTKRQGKEINTLIICDTFLDEFLESSNTAGCFHFFFKSIN